MATRRDIAAGIRKARLRKGLSQDAVARQVGVSRQMVIHWENGRSVPMLSRADKVADLLNIPRRRLDLDAAGPSREALAIARLIDEAIEERVGALVGGRA